MNFASARPNALNASSALGTLLFLVLVLLPSGGGASPTPFDPVAFSAVGGRAYWVLGHIPCASGRCYAIRRTTDGGRSFATSPAPPLSPTPTTPVLEFADRRDGYALVPGVGGSTYATHDGGSTWRRLSLRTVLAFAARDGHAYAVTARCTLRSCAAYRFVRSSAPGGGWETAAMPFTPDGSTVGLAVYRSSVWILGTGPSRRLLTNDVLARSRDGGRTFVRGAGPCVPGLGGKLEPVSTVTLWAVCPTGLSAGAWRSADGGRRFRRVTTPPLVNSAALAPATGATAVLAPNGAGSHVLRTTDGGGKWGATRTPSRAIFVPWLGFVDARLGFALAQIDSAGRTALWRTSDAGAHWAGVRLS